MNEEQMRHWLAMHCPVGVAANIFCELDRHEQGKSFEERYGVKLTNELTRYVWADRMLAASAVQLVEITRDA